MTQRTCSSCSPTQARPHLRRKPLLRGRAKKPPGREPLVTAFYAWSESVRPGAESLEERVARHKTQLGSFRDLRERAVLEVATAVWLHQTVVAWLPGFPFSPGRGAIS